jgi:hypothetical protein
MVTTTRAQAAHKDGMNAALAASSPSRSNAALSIRPRAYGESSITGAEISTTMVDGVSVEVADLVEEDVNMPADSVSAQHTGGRSESATIAEASTTPAVVLMGTAMNTMK